MIYHAKPYACFAAALLGIASGNAAGYLCAAILATAGGYILWMRSR